MVTMCHVYFFLGFWFGDSPAHAVQGLVEDLRGQGVLLLQDLTLLQRQRHGRAVLGALTAGESDAVQAATHLQGSDNKV